MTFPLAEWIDGHERCRYNLGKSGMVGSVRSPVPSASEVRRADPKELRRRLGDDLGVDPRRVFLSTGGSQANALALFFLARRRRKTSRCRVAYPEYPPLFDTARAAGFRLTSDPGRVDVALVSQPRNPEGDLWDWPRLRSFAAGASSVLVDETFREFSRSASVLRAGVPHLWTSGSFTKFYAGDDLRVGFLVAPEEDRRAFGRFHGLVTNLLSPYSVAGALRALRDRALTRREVDGVLERNIATLLRGLPDIVRPVGPVSFDRLETGESGDHLAARAVRRSVLVCSGSFFGEPFGVRLGLTRRTFPRDFAKYLEVRGSGRGRARR